MSASPDVRPGRASVIVPAYNHEAYIEQTLRSIEDQTYGDVEVVVVDDGSRDGTAAVAERVLAAGRRPYRLLRQANQGVVRAIANGLAASSGEYVSFLASDDWIAPDKLERQVAALKSVPCDAAFGNVVFVRDGGRQETFWNPVPFVDHWDPDEFIEGVFLARGPMLQSGLFRRSILDAVGGVDQGFPQEDWPILVRVAKTAQRVWVETHPVAFYRLHGQNTVRTRAAQLVRWKSDIADRFLTGRSRRRAKASAHYIFARETMTTMPARAFWAFLRAEAYYPSGRRLGKYLAAYVRHGLPLYVANKVRRSRKEGA